MNYVIAKCNEVPTASGSELLWNAAGNDIYYQGDIKKELPVTYTLDGKEISPEGISGKNGRVYICLQYENRQYEMAEINGKEGKIYILFAVVTGMLLDDEFFQNVEVTGGKLINDRDRVAVVDLTFPSLREDLGIDREMLGIPDRFEITEEVEE